MKKYKARDITHYLLILAEELDISVSTLKMQKIIYILHGIYMVEHKGDSFLGDPVQAYKYGPVIYSLYHELGHLGANPITVKDLKDTVKINKHVKQWIRVAGKSLLKLHVNVLANLGTAKGSPWGETTNKDGGHIPDWKIRDYFTKLVEIDRGGNNAN